MTLPIRIAVRAARGAAVAAPAPAAPAPTGERVTLAVPHTHAGQRYPAGAILTVDAPTAAWLRRVGVVKTPAAPAIDKE